MGDIKKSLPGVELVAKELAEVEKLLNAETRSEVRLVTEVAHHILGSGGKRFRPLLTLLSGKMLGIRKKKELVAYAAAIEFAHTATLLHDDVIDEADVRRGLRSSNRLFGNAPSIIVGDYVLFKAFNLLLSGGNLKVVKLVSGVSMEMAEGEAYQLAQKQRVDLTESEYERIIRSKTALLIQTCCQLAAVAQGEPKKVEIALAAFGYRLGLAFQIVDDVLDYAAVDKKWGKQVGKDFLEGKTTLPLIIAHQSANADERKELAELFGKDVRRPEELGRVLALFDKYDALKRADASARRNIALARKSLSIFPESSARAALLALADYVVERSI